MRSSRESAARLDDTLRKEREAHTTIYAGMLKKHGHVVEGRKAQAETQAVRKGGAIPEPFGHSLIRKAPLCIETGSELAGGEPAL